jgi:hypothetical protein
MLSGEEYKLETDLLILLKHLKATADDLDLAILLPRPFVDYETIALVGLG